MNDQIRIEKLAMILKKPDETIIFPSKMSLLNGCQPNEFGILASRRIR